MVQEVNAPRRSTETTIEALRMARKIRGSIAPIDIISACRTTQSALGIISIKCEDMPSHELQRRLAIALRDTDLIYHKDDVIQVFAPVSQEDGVKRLYNRIFAELPDKQQVYLNYFDRSLELFSYDRRADRTELMDVALGGKPSLAQEAYISSDQVSSKKEVMDYLRLVHSINPSILGKEVKVIYTQAEGFDYIRGINRDNEEDSWAMISGEKTDIEPTQDISHMVQGNDFVVYKINGARKYSFDSKTANLSLKEE